MAENQWVCPGVSSFHPYKWAMKKPSYFSIILVVAGLWNNPHITGVVCHPPQKYPQQPGALFSWASCDKSHLEYQNIILNILPTVAFPWYTPSKNILVGGWTNPLEKHARQIGIISPNFGMNIKKYFTCHHLGRVNNSIHSFIKAIYRSYFTQFITIVLAHLVLKRFHWEGTGYAMNHFATCQLPPSDPPRLVDKAAAKDKAVWCPSWDPSQTHQWYIYLYSLYMGVS